MSAKRSEAAKLFKIFVKRIAKIYFECTIGFCMVKRETM